MGFSHFCPSRDEDAGASVGELTSLYVRAGSRGRGLGRALMTAALEALQEAGFTVATLWVLDSHDRARAFYEAEGWRWDGSEQHDRIGQLVTELRYRRLLV